MRRKQLKPDTFPFLAVLPCTMGSLILLLMVLDRRARLAARARAEEAWARVEKEKADRRSRQEQEAGARRAKHRREQTKFLTEEQRLRAEYERTRSRLQ